MELGMTSSPPETREDSGSCTMVIFGATGDLTRRKLIPALYGLSMERRLPDQFSVLGYARSEMNDEEFRRKMRDAVSEFSRLGLKDEAVWNSFAQHLFFLPGNYQEPKDYLRLKEALAKLDRRNRIFYLAIPPISMPP